jgi:hypothetical protein
VGPLLALAALAPLTALSSCSDVKASEAYCEQARKAEATADPLKDDAVANDPTKLEAAMLARVQLYTALAGAAPAEIREKARTLQDAFARLYNALKAIGFDRARANGDSGVRAVLDDAKVGEAVTSLQSYGQKACGIPAP